MKEKNIVKKAVVLLCTLLMVFSSGVVIANTREMNNNMSTTLPLYTSNAPPTRGLIWDNVMGVAGSRGGIIVATVRTEGTAFPADDFQLATQQTVTSVAWQGGYFQCQLAQGQKDYHWDWRILFWNDIGNGSWPGTEIYNHTIPDASITRSFWYNYTRPDNGNTYWVANYSCQLQVPITFTANTKYWITIQAIQTPNSYPQGAWCRHNSSQSPIKLHEAMIKAPYWLYPNWVTVMTLLIAGADPNPLPHDLNFQLFSGAANQPPVTPAAPTGPTSGFTGVSYSFSATTTDPEGDNISYMLDWGDGNFSSWLGPYPSGATATTLHAWASAGTYDVKVKAKDSNGAESGWSPAHSIVITAGPSIEIGDITGGLFKVKAVIKNTGGGAATNISWKIELTGGLIILGKVSTGTIPTIAAAGQATVSSKLILGFGKTVVKVTADTATKSVNATVLLVFIKI